MAFLNNFQKEYDVDTSEKNGKWSCKFYHNNHEAASVWDCATEKEAQEKVIEKILALGPKHRPDDLTKVIWNPSTFWGGGKDSFSLNGGSNTGFSTYVHCDHDPSDKKNVVFELNGVKIIGATKSKIEPLDKKSKKKRLIINCSGTELGPYVSPTAQANKNPITKVVGLSLKDTMFNTNYFLPPPPPPFYGDEVVLDWGDQKAAPVRTEFWKDLYDWINPLPNMLPFPYTEIVFCCVGGHGRTGTAIASLAVVSGIWDEKTLVDKDKKPVPKEETSLADIAIAYTKALYCKSAIESDAQFEYVEKVEKEQRSDKS